MYIIHNFPFLESHKFYDTYEPTEWVITNTTLKRIDEKKIIKAYNKVQNY